MMRNLRPLAGFLGVVVGIAAGVGWWALFHRVREVRSAVAIPCGGTALEVRRVYEQTGHTPLSFGMLTVEIGPPGGPGDAVRVEPVPGPWVAPGELPAQVASGPGDPAWQVYAPDPARYACLAASLPAVRAALGPADGATEVVVWAGAPEDVWPVFRAPDGRQVRVRQDGRVQVETFQEHSQETHGVGNFTRDAAGERVLVLEGDHSVLDAAVDGQGRLLGQRFPARRETPNEDH